MQADDGTSKRSSLVFAIGLWGGLAAGGLLAGVLALPALGQTHKGGEAAEQDAPLEARAGGRPWRAMRGATRSECASGRRTLPQRTSPQREQVLTSYAVQGVEAYVAEGLRPDGRSVDFEKRDAIVPIPKRGKQAVVEQEEGTLLSSAASYHTSRQRKDHVPERPTSQAAQLFSTADDLENT